MTWSYSGNPASSTKDAVRFLIGDTDTNDQQVSDEEIAYLLGLTSDDPNAAAVRAARALASKYAKYPSAKTVGDLSITYGERAKVFTDLAASLAEQAVLTAPPYLGGILVAEKEGRAADTSLEQPAFKRGAMDNVGR